MENDDEKVDRLLDDMLKHWKMERPNLLISVTGGAKSCSLKPGMMDVFRHGLVKAAEGTGILLSLLEVNINSYCLLFGLGSFLRATAKYAKRAYAIAIPSVCPSVSPSVRLYVCHTGDSCKTVVLRIVQFSPYSSPIPLVFAR